MNRTAALEKMIDEALAAAAKAEARGQIKAAARHYARVGRLLNS